MPDTELIHCDELDSTLIRLVGLTESVSEEGEVPGHFENIGLCHDCLMTISQKYAVAQLLGQTPSILGAVAHDALPQSQQDDESQLFYLMEAMLMASFQRGLTVGMVLGREHPA